MQNIFHYDFIIKQFRDFFQNKKKFVEVPAQSRLSILAACEDPKTIAAFNFNNLDYPLPQTGQMWLEYELLKNPNVPGVFCVTTSYRNEAHPIPGRHDKIFPMFEFESHGTVQDLKKLIIELLEHFGFEQPASCLYNEMCKLYNTDALEAEHEIKMQQEYGNVICLEQFPQRSHPFWNMKHAGENIYNKIDVLLYGMETFGTAERSIDIQEMRHYFLTISDGMYANLLYQKFGEQRVLSELDTYLNLPMFPRFGGGIGVTRMERALLLAKLMNDKSKA
jgi:hypothetical protein